MVGGKEPGRLTTCWRPHVPNCHRNWSWKGLKLIIQLIYSQQMKRTRRSESFFRARKHYNTLALARNMSSACCWHCASDYGWYEGLLGSSWWRWTIHRRWDYPEESWQEDFHLSEFRISGLIRLVDSGKTLKAECPASAPVRTLAPYLAVLRQRLFP